MRRGSRKNPGRARRKAYRIEFTDEAGEHLAALTARQRVTLLDQIGRQLTIEPTTETRNRKELRPNPVARFRLRVGDLRVYYDVQESDLRIVTIRAVGIKDRERITIGGVEIEL